MIFDRYSCQDLQGWSGGGRRRTRTGPGLAGSFPSGPGKYGLEVRTRPEYARRGEGRPGAPPQCPHTGAKADTNLIDMNLSAFSYTGLRDSCQDLQATLSGIRTRTCWNGPRGLSAGLASTPHFVLACIWPWRKHCKHRGGWCQWYVAKGRARWIASFSET